jgi:hypothetical protein
MISEFSNATACILMALAQLAITASGLAFMLSFRAAAGRLFLAGIALAVAAAVIPDAISQIVPELIQFLQSFGLLLVLFLLAVLLIRFLPLQAITRWLYGRPARGRAPGSSPNSPPSSRTFPGYRNR